MPGKVKAASMTGGKMEGKERTVTPEGFRKLVQSQEKEFIIHVEIGKETADGKDKRGKPA